MPAVKSLAAFWAAISLGMCPKPILDRDPAEGEDPAAATARAAFTSELSAFYRDTAYLRWLDAISHGMDASAGQRPFALYWDGVTLSKHEGTVVFRHDDWADNTMIPSSRVMGQLGALYLWSGNPRAGRLAAQYARGLSSTMLGLQWSAVDPLRSIMARAIFPQSHTIEREGGLAFVDYTPVSKPRDDWNTETIRVANNPHWPEAWAQTIRSKDDVPHIYLAATVLPHLRAFAADTSVREAAGEAYDLLRGFARDIVDHHYWIRSKREDGSVYYPGLYPSDERVSDLANFSLFQYVYPKGECDARLSTALLGYEERRGEDCGDGLVRTVDLVATEANFYNYLILSTFHLSATMIAVEQGRDAMAEALLAGLASRMDFDLNLKASEIPEGDIARWQADLAVFIVYAAAAGMAVPPHAVRFVQAQFSAALPRLREFPAYDPWSVPDGEYPLHPTGRGIGADEIGVFFWYCWSPYRASSPLIVDCEALRATAVSL